MVNMSRTTTAGRVGGGPASRGKTKKGRGEARARDRGHGHRRANLSGGTNVGCMSAAPVAAGNYYY
jgi:hypothetical protein